jgi:hypothetical protein
MWKWFFAYNGEHASFFDAHIEIMLRSAREHTSLQPHLLYHGNRDHPVLSLMERYGVTVIHHTASVLPDLERIKAKFPDYAIKLASGTFLRIDVPLIVQRLGYTDEFVFYTDVDVVFQHDLPPVASEPFLRPAYFSCAPERYQAGTNMNAGVMVMNVNSLAADHGPFKDFITAGDTLYHELFEQGPFDQQAYRLYYEGRWDRLPPEYNWKPYWGFNEDARIVHFHGPKIPQVQRALRGEQSHMSNDVEDLYKGDPGSYERYLERFERYTRPAPVPADAG